MALEVKSHSSDTYKGWHGLILDTDTLEVKQGFFMDSTNYRPFQDTSDFILVK